MGKLEDIEKKIELLEKDIEKLKSSPQDEKVINGRAIERVGKEFKSWVEEIQKERLKRLKDTKKMSFEKIVSMIPKHNSANKIKEDLIKFKFE